MKKRKQSLLALFLIAALTFCGCGGDTDTDTNTNAVSSLPEGETLENGIDTVTIKLLLKGAKPNGFDEVYEEFLNRTKDTLGIELDYTWVDHADYNDKLNLEITSGAEYDLVFDGPWLHLKELASEGYYADLSEYFNNPDYPGLYKSFPEETMKNNIYFGRMCFIPLLRGQGLNVQSILYRLDLAEKWGIGVIESNEQLEAYWTRAKEEGLLPISMRGFGTYLTNDGYYTDAAKAGIMSVSVANLDIFFCVENGKVTAMAPSGAGDEAFQDFPEGFNYDFTIERYETFEDYAERGFTSPDSITVTDPDTPFWTGKAASTIARDPSLSSQKLAEFTPGAQLGEYVWVDEIRNLEKHAILTDYLGQNGLCIPESSEKKEDVIRFLDWMFSSKENHDLFELGLEGKDYEITEYGTYNALSSYPLEFPGYGLTWNNNYVTFTEQQRLSQHGLTYSEYALQEDTYQGLPVCGFLLDTTTDMELATYVAQVAPVAGKVSTAKSHGILNDGTKTYNSMAEMLKTNIDECYEAGLQNIMDALEEQLNAHMEAQAKRN